MGIGVWGAGLALAGLAALAAYMAAEAAGRRLTRHSLTIPRLGAGMDGTSILFVSDLHGRTIPPDWLAKALQNKRPDMILLGGDIADKGVSMDRISRTMRTLRGIAPVYAVFGNGDYRTDHRRLDLVLRTAGVNVLGNESVYLESKGDGLHLIGVDDPATGRDRLSLAYADVPGEAPCLLLAHSPAIADRLEGHRADLILAGHTHGGQICLPLIGSPYLRWLRPARYRAGEYSLQSAPGGSTMLVSRGYGSGRIPLRLLSPPEMHLITLRSGQPGD